LSHLNYLNNNKNYFIFSFFIIFITLINIIPFVLIERPQFLYHAFECVLFAILGLALSLKTIYFIPNDIISENSKNNILWGFTAFITILLFIFFIIELPLIYGFPFHDSMAHSMFQLF
jgi:dolichyl-phosphate-mannose--protein O-mannosyl transferase